MRRIHIVGRKNTGKTTLIIELVGELTRRGYRVGTIKHTFHGHPVDVLGKDSARHSQAGGHPAAFVAGDKAGIFIDVPQGDLLYKSIESFYLDCDLVLVEGHLETTAPKIEVWRPSALEPPLTGSRKDITALVTDEKVDVQVPVWRRSELGDLAEKILSIE